MSFRLYIIYLSIGTLLAASALTVIVTRLEPVKAQFFAFVVFYAAVFLLLAGVLTLLGLAARRLLFRRNDLIYRSAANSTRQAALASGVLIISLGLKGQDLFRPWNALALIAIAVALEFFFVSARVRR